MKTWLQAHRVLLGVAAIVVVLAAGGVYVVATAADRNAETAGASAPVSGDLLFVDMKDGQDHVEKVRQDAPGGPRGATALRCQRIYVAGGVTVCLRLAGLGPTYEAAVLDASGKELRTIGLAGIPNRARVSASGQIISWTTFVSGDSYTVPGGFSTRTGILDLRTGQVVDTLETFTATVAGQEFTIADRNFWGVTVAADDRTFYATMASQNRTWLMKGDLVAKTLTDVRQTAECPSLSPDGTRIAYKKRTSRLGPWELAVLDLGTGKEMALPGTTGIDDQAAWLDDGRLAYGKASQPGQKPSIYAVPADGSAQPSLLVADAASPVPLH
ncbi:WD40-like Beta Propeller Repeat [Amycolatopsis xylanica]|uniref:WD40-like Beta Propeller Repeat n=1 Tax=Amycolatopsis xylanica TaxID=589385 RepID=A0A1H3LA78_9PSEU|nr:PD40 domain-containing protein [Amycolatopsis xylanica]SDY60795.1 WD40-like Beta Propeller Repeat [Amycolatopsis xylanica]